VTSASPDPYATLGVAATATDDELRSAYRRLVQRHHPDHNGGSHESALRFAEVQEAYAHVRLLRRRATTSARAGEPASVDDRIAQMERELRDARAHRERAARVARDARAGAARAAREAAARATRPESADGPSDEELGYVSTEDSFTKILDDFADQVSARFSEAHDVPRSGQPRRPRSVADWIDELGSRLTGDRPGRDDDSS
jgi:curved DNA-binding protein CbpA